MYKIIADSSCDLLEIPGIPFEAVPLTISTDEKEYVDDASIDCHEMLDYMASYNGRSFTACPSAQRWLKAFEGADELYVITLTSGLSGTYNSACLAAQLYQEAHPDARICLIDSLTTGPEMRLLIERLALLKKRNKEMKEIEEDLHKYMKYTQLYFAFSSLHNFAQNGRVSKITASAIGKLGICIIGKANETGTITPIGKCRGDKKIIAQLLDQAERGRCHGHKIRICHVENASLAEKTAEAFRSVYPNADILVYPARGLVSYYGERGGIIVAFD